MVTKEQIRKSQAILKGEDALDDVLHKWGYTIDHRKIRDKIRELIKPTKRGKR